MSFRQLFPKSISLAVVIFISLVFVVVKVRQVTSHPAYIQRSDALSWDVYGYYLHLPAAFIYHDPGIEKKDWLDSVNNKYQQGRPLYQLREGKDNRLVNVYPVGLSVCNLPFFLAAHISAGWFGYARDGFSPPYQWMMIFSGLCWGIFGLFLLRKLLLIYFFEKITALIILCLGFGTNLFFYAGYDVTMPHIFLFTISIGIILLTISWHEHPSKKTALFIGATIGLATIIRPSEIVWLLVPLLWNVGGIKSLKDKIILLKKNYLHVLLLAFGMIVVGSLQLFYWKYTSGKWFFWTHNEGFDFFRPFTIEFLFSYKKGWLLYTPMMIFAIAGIALLYKKEKKLFVPVLLIFLVNLWVISSWECWWYAGSFSQRPMVESYGLMAIPLGVFLRTMFSHKILRLVSTPFVAFFTLLNLFQTWQVQHSIIDGVRMTKAYYWKVFGKTEIDPRWTSLLEIDRYNPPPLDDVKNSMHALPVFFHDYENGSNGNITCDTMGFLSKKSIVLDSNTQIAEVIRVPYDSLTQKDFLRMRISAEVYTTSSLADDDFLFACAMTNRRGKIYGYNGFPFDTLNVTPGKWCRISADYITPYILHRSDKLLINVWDAGGSKIFVDNVRLEMYEPGE